MVIFLLLAAAIAGCTTTFAEDLRSLQSDAMASPALPGTELVRKSETDAEVGFMHKPGLAMIQLTFKTTGRDLASIKEDAVDRAQAAGWRVDDRDADVVRGQKEFDTGGATIGISIIDTEEGQRLLIILTHEFNHPTN